MGIMNICNSENKHSHKKEKCIKKEEQFHINIDDNDNDMNINSKDISKPITPTTHNDTISHSDNDNIYNNNNKSSIKHIKRSYLKDVLKHNAKGFISNIILVTNATVKNNNILSLTNAISRNKRNVNDNNNNEEEEEEENESGFNNEMVNNFKSKDENYFQCQEIPISKTQNEVSFSMFITPEENENLNKISKNNNKHNKNNVYKKPTLASIKINIQNIIKDDNDNVNKNKLILTKRTLKSAKNQKSIINTNTQIQSTRTPKRKYKPKMKKLVNDLTNVTAIKKEMNDNDKNDFGDESGTLLRLLDDMCHTTSKFKINNKYNNMNYNNFLTKTNPHKENRNIYMNSSRKILYKKRNINQFKICPNFDSCTVKLKKSLSNKALISNSKLNNN